MYTIAEFEGTIYETMSHFGVTKDVVWKIKNNVTWKDEFNIKKPKKHINKLKEEDVIDIYTSDLSGVVMAKKYNISPNTVYDIRKKRIWKNITDKIDKGE